MNKKLVAVAVAGVLARPAGCASANRERDAVRSLEHRLGSRQRQAVTPTCADGARQPERLSREHELVASRRAWHGSAGRRSECDLPDRIRTCQRRHGRRPSLRHRSRETFVGLQGAWGTFKMGNFLTPYDDMHPIFGNVPTLTTSILSTADSVGARPAEQGQRRLRRRARGNSIRYDSPSMRGLHGFGRRCRTRDSSGWPTSAPAGGDNGDAHAELRHAYVWASAGFYNNGPLQGGLAYEAQRQGSRCRTSTTTACTIAGAWNFGIIKVRRRCTSASNTTPRRAT